MGLHLFGCVCGHIHSKGALMGMAEEHVSVPVPFYVIEHEKGVVLFDCGMPAAMRDPNETYLTALRSAGMDVEIGAGETVTGRLHGLDIDPARVRFVVLSHLHFDHCGGPRRTAEREDRRASARVGGRRGSRSGGAPLFTPKLF
jgi:glyoxylase-like metal-dependent hydrolase (beta-lactamase superfamily II)